jgi:hypothetical protein
LKAVAAVSAGGAGEVSEGGKAMVGLVLFAGIAAMAWMTMEAGPMRTLVLVVLAGFALRVLLGMRRSRYDGSGGSEQ